MREKCACGIYLINREDATFMRDGAPLCAHSTCQKVQEHHGLRRVPFADEIGLDIQED